MNQQANAWLRMGRQLRRKVNFGHWLDKAAVPTVATAGCASAGLLLVRHQWPSLNEIWLPAASLCLPLIALLAALWLARRSFITIDQALVRLEMKYGLHAALSTAHAGVGNWPPVPLRKHDGLRWRWSRACIPPLLAAMLIAGAWFVPVTARTDVSRITEPASWNLVETNLQSMIEQRLIEPRSTEDTKKAIDSLRERPQEQWFDHSSIEAGDRILLDHQRDVSDLERRMRDASRALRNAARARQGMEPNQNSPDPTLAGIPAALKMGDLVPNQELIEKLQQMLDPENGGLNQIDPRQLADLLDQLEKNADLLAEMLGQFQGLPGIDPADLAGDGQGQGQCNGECGGQCDGQCDGKGKPGQGAPMRGPGEGGPLFGKERNGLEAQQPKPLPTGDLSRSTPGDLVGVGETKHEIDPTQSPTLSNGGSPVQPGDGGGAVWQDSLDPKEQDALRKFFE